MARQFEGQTALVTGGGRGIGRAICTRLASRGADVVVADIDEDEMSETCELVENEGRRALPLYTDLLEPETVESTVEEALSEFDSVEMLVNNSGIAGPTSLCEEVTLEEWDETLGINLRGVFLMTSQLLPSMKEAGYGRIVNISSVTAKRPLYGRTPYAASKAGIIGFTRTLADEVGEHDINVNAICPGSVEGPRIRDVYEKQAEARDMSYEEVRSEQASASPRNELVQGDDVARLVAFLCSEDATRMTGQDLNISAGKVMY